MNLHGSDVMKMRAVKWGYQPVGPFCVVKQDFGSAAVGYDNFTTLEEAVDVFVMTALPTVGTQIAFLHDSNGARLVAYFVAFPGRPADWYGTAKGFEVLATHRFVEPLQIALAEIDAKARSIDV